PLDPPPRLDGAELLRAPISPAHRDDLDPVCDPLPRRPAGRPAPPPPRPGAPLGERAGPRRRAAVAVGFVGVLVITRPGLGGLHPAAFLSVAGAVCYALYSIATRILAAYDSSATTHFYSV